MTPDISVIIPAYNGELTIARAVNSVLSQTGVDVQVVIVDDCSTDGTPVTALNLCLHELRTRLIHHTENQRQGAAMNTGLAAATGRYMLRLDQDDWLEPGSLQALVAALDANPAAMFAYGAIQYHGRRSILAKPAPFKPADFYRHNASGYCYLFRREAYEAGIRYVETGDLINVGDWIHVLDMIERGYTGIALPDVTVLNYVYGWTGTSSALAADEPTVLAALRERYPKLEAVAL